MTQRTVVSALWAAVLLASNAAAAPAFPGAVGFGTETPGGRGGKVIKVTTLAADGEGSLRAALEAAGPRIVVFEVGGIIDLDKKRLEIKEPFVTVAGQTAPSPGITVIRGALSITTHDVVLQHLRFRLGDAGAAKKSGFEPDVTTSGPDAHDVVIDHCSFSWAVDENLSVSGPRHDGPEKTSRRITLSRNIIAEGLHDSVHEKGPHSMGTLVHDYCNDIAVIGNFYAHNFERNPWFKGFATGVIVNNLIYNPGKWAMRLGPVIKEWEKVETKPEAPRVSIVGNVMRYGANTQSGLNMVSGNSPGLAFLEDNLAFDSNGQPVAPAGGEVKHLTEKPSWPAGLKAMPAAETANHVLATAGARPADRDEVDRRLVADFRAGKGKLINSQDEVGGYPKAAATQRKLKVPKKAKDVDAWLAGYAAEVEKAAKP